jgi:hypothetical protein
MQHGGDIIFVPHLYGHGTYTVKDSVGVAVELTTKASPGAPGCGH